MNLDIDKLRADTPALQQWVHFNNAGASLMPRSVFAALEDYQRLEQTRGGYEAQLECSEQLDDFYRSGARLLGCAPNEIAFCESATRAWQQFFYSIRWRPRARLITTQLDYGSNMVSYIQQQQGAGVEVVIIARDSNGDIDLEAMRKQLDARTQLIALSHIPTASGLINPAAAVGKLAQQAGVPYLLDACQSVGQIEVDVKQIGCTALSATGRKYLRGPRGTGLLYVDQAQLQHFAPLYLEQHAVNLLDKQRYELHDSARRFENFEGHFAGKLALGRAMEYANTLGMQQIQARIVALAARLRQMLGELPGITLADQGSQLGGIVTFSSAAFTPTEIRQRLWQQKINVWVSSGPGSLIDFQARGITALVRASLHYFNTEAELEKLVEALAALPR